MDISGFDVRAIGPDELDAWWELRLRGLRDHPDAFGADYQASKERGPEHLRPSTREGGESRLFAAFTRDGQLVAQVAVARLEGKRSHIAMIYSVHTDARFRGLGLSKALIAHAVGHCRALPGVRQIGIAVNARNHPAIAVYTGAGFVAWGTEPQALATADGFHDEIHMMLMLDDTPRP
jgi:RimJ/RimL family protein N-acetyltransferase